MYPAEMMCLITKDLSAPVRIPAQLARESPDSRAGEPNLLLRLISPLRREDLGAWLSIRRHRFLAAASELPFGSREQR